MRRWSASAVAAAAGARLLAGGDDAGPTRAVIDSRAAGPGDLFVGLQGEHVDGGRFAAGALEAGAWGVLLAPEHAEALAGTPTGAVLAHPDPLRALGALARSWRRELGAEVVGITGSVGKTSTKDILAALLAPERRTVASPANLNTEIGLPLAVLEAPEATEVLVLEMAMRGPGQIAELASIAEPGIGVVTNIGPVHLELLGSIEAIAAAKAELIAGLRPGGTAVLPAGERLLDPHRREDVRTVTFGPGGDVRLIAGPDVEGSVLVEAGDRHLALRPTFAEAHNLRNLLAAVAAAEALGVEPHGAVQVPFSALRGELVSLPGGAVLINDCYNANPISMRAALDELTAGAPAGRRVAVLGDMLELGPEEGRFHRETGAYAARRGVEVLVAVGPRSRETAAGYGGAGEAHLAADADAAARVLAGILRDGDRVLVKASRGMRLETVAESLLAGGRPG